MEGSYRSRKLLKTNKGGLEVRKTKFKGKSVDNGEWVYGWV